jgi:formylglycine-generating enzyme required for sulfatase activity
MRHKRHILYSGLLVVVLVGLMVINPSAAQDDPIQETLDAAVEGLFTATAQAGVYLNSTLQFTVESAFYAAQTATASGVPSATPGPGTPTATSEAALTMTDAARILTSTAGLPLTATAFFESVPEWVDQVASDLVRVDGGTFEMGTTPQEVAAAVSECVDVQGGNCQLAFGEDSVPPHPVTVSAFQIEWTEVTNQQFLVFLNALGAGSHLTGCDGQPCAMTRNEDENSNIDFNGFSYQVVGAVSEHPVVNVTWYGADAYYARQNQHSTG